MTTDNSMKMICGMLLLIVVTLITGCPSSDLSLRVSEGVHDFGSSECVWTFYVYKSGRGGGTFRVSSDVPWAKPLTPGGIVGPNGHTPVVVAIDRSELGKLDHEGTLTITYGAEAASEYWIQLYVTDGSQDFARVRDYWPFAIGRQWTYAAHAEDVGGAEGDLTPVESSRLTVTGSCRRFGFDIWECSYEEFPAKTTRTLYAVFIDEYPVFVQDPAVLNLLPNTDAIFDASFSDEATDYWYKGIFSTLDLDVYTNTSRSTVLPLREITPMRYVSTASKIHADEIPVPRSTSCLALLGDPFFDFRQRRIYFALLARGVGPLMDPFGGSGILQSVTND